MTYEFHWKCQICKEPIKENLIEKWVDGRKARYHRSCLDKEELALKEANRILGRMSGGKHKYE